MFRTVHNRQEIVLYSSLPYLALIGFLLLSWLIGRESGQWLWNVLRWGLRIGYVVGTVVLWQRVYVPQQTTPQSITQPTDPPHFATPPLWFYGWLGFATYEIVALLLEWGMRLATQLSTFSSWLILLSLLLSAIAFVPHILVAFLPGRHDRQLAAYTIFPHAALTFPLFYLVMQSGFPQEGDDTLTALLVVPVACAAIVVMSFPLVTSRENRWWLLYGGVVLCQILFPIVASMQQGGGIFILLLTVPLIILGLFILSEPMLLQLSWQMAVQFAHRLLGVARIHTLQQQVVQWLHWQFPSFAVLPLFHPITVEMVLEGVPVSSTTSRANHFATGPSDLRQTKPQSVVIGEQMMSQTESNGTTTEQASIPPTMPSTQPPQRPTPKPMGPGIERLYKLSVVVIAAMIVLGGVLFVGRAAVYKIHEYERGLHLRGGRFLAVQQPGWHVQIPLVDTVIIVKVNERLGYVERIEAMTSDNVTMIVSLQYTYRVMDPEQYALQVDDPERIVFEFVQGKLRDVVNTKAMTDVMNDRALMNQEVMEDLKAKEDQYGVQFVTVQMQSASPPDEVLTAIKDRMVAAQRQEQAQAEAAQQRTIAEAELFSAQKRAEAGAYEITRTAEAEAERIRLTTEAQQMSIRSIIDELDGKGELANKFLDYLIAQELKENSKWIINGEGTPLVNVQQ